MATSSAQSEDDYDPYDHYENAHPLTYFETLFHWLKGAFGTGVLAFPLAFYFAGYVFGVIGAFTMGTFCTYCIHMLERTEYKLCKIRKTPKMSYPQTATVALEEGPWKRAAPYATPVCNAFIIIYQMGSCVVYFIFISENIQKVIESQFDKTVNLLPICNGIIIFYHMGACAVFFIFIGDNIQKVIESQFDQSVRFVYIITIVLVPVILINLVKNLKWLAPLSALANLLTVVSFIIIFYYIIRKGVTFKDRRKFGDFKDYPLFIGTCCFAMVSIGVVMPLKNEMKNARKFGSTFGVVNVGMGFIMVIYTCVGFFGYLAYDKAGGSISYTIGRRKDWLADSCKILLSIAIFLTHALCLFIVIDIIWNQWLLGKLEAKGTKYKLLHEYLVRIALVVVTYLCAAALPYIDTFISLVGSICVSNLSIAFPAIIDSSYNWYRLKQSKKQYWVHTKNFLIFLIGMFVMIVGLITSTMDFIAKIGENHGGKNQSSTTTTSSP